MTEIEQDSKHGVKPNPEIFLLASAVDCVANDRKDTTLWRYRGQGTNLAPEASQFVIRQASERCTVHFLKTAPLASADTIASFQVITPI
jgi:hypothetical protein